MEKFQKINFASMVMEGGLFQICNKFWDLSTVVPLFIMAYAGSMTVVGLASTLSMTASVLVSLVFGVFIHRIKDLARFQFYVFLLRGTPLLLAPVLLYTSSPQAAIIAFLIIFMIFNSSTGIVGVTWWDIMARTIPAENRGQLIGLQQVAAGIGSLITGVVIKMILASQSISNSLRFAILFTGVGLFGLASALFMSRVRDPYRRQTVSADSNFSFIFQFPILLRMNPNYCRILLLQAIQYGIIATIPFLILFEKQYFHLNAGQVSTLVFLQILGMLLGGLVWGQLSKRKDNPHVIRVSLATTLSLMLAAIACYFFKSSLPVPMAILSLLSIVAGACQLSFMYNRSYLLDVADEENRTTYLVMNTTLLFPFYFLSLLAGMAADRFGFLPLLFIGAISASACLFIARGLLSKEKLPSWQQELKIRLAHRGEQVKQV